MTNRCFRLLLLVIAAQLPVGSTTDAQEFQTVVLDPQIGKVCYAVTAADVNGDGRLDAVAISENQAVWYQNPGWKKQVMISDAVSKDHVCLAAHDIDGDGNVDFALGAGWPKSGGSIHWISRGSSLEKPWSVHNIGAEAWTHRMRFADVLGSGKPQLVVSPLNATNGPGVRMLAYPIPDDPTSDAWKPVVMDGSRNRVHNHWHLSGSGKAADTIVASQEGLSLLKRTGSGFSLSPIAGGASGDKPTATGSGEVKSGKLASGQPILATIEPMHGNQVVVYLTNKSLAVDKTERIVLDDSFNQGHAIWCADFDGDGNDEVVAAHRQAGKGEVAGPAIFIYQAADSDGRKWKRRVLDANMACEDLWCADFNGDGRTDILAGGRATHDVKLYLNQAEK